LEGIAATEAADSTVVGANLIPTIALGIPGNVVAALMAGAFIIHGLVPGPFMVTDHGELVYSRFACMLIANLIHIIMGPIGINIWGFFMQVPTNIILPIVVVLCIAGVYIPANSMFHVGLMLAFGGIGYLMRKSGFTMVGLVMGYLLGPNFELSFRQTMLMYKSDITTMFSSPISLVFLLMTVLFVRKFGLSSTDNSPSLRDYFIRHPFCETEPLRISEAFSMCGIIGQCVPE
jgi:putative tricarboxylic transport membrane protein